MKTPRTDALREQYAHHLPNWLATDVFCPLAECLERELSEIRERAEYEFDLRKNSNANLPRRGVNALNGLQNDEKTTTRSEHVKQYTMSNTPRTDDQVSRYYDDATGRRIEYVPAKFARQLEREVIQRERELAEAREEIVDALKELCERRER